MKRTILLDADILAYQTSASNQRNYDWGDGVSSVAADEAKARKGSEETIERLAERLKADEVIVCLSDDFNSFRKSLVLPTYKAARAHSERPVHLYDIKDWMRETYTIEERHSLEADDVMGILATDPGRKDERIIVSADKDLMTIPGKLYRPQVQKGKQPVVFEITPIEAMRFHFYQTLVGDITDGYTGLPGVGPKSDYVLSVLQAESEEEAWDDVLAAYGGKGLTEDDALVQARLARILQHGDHDGRRVRLWIPPAWDEPEGDDDDALVSYAGTAAAAPS